MKEQIVTAKNLSKSYGDFLAVDGVDFEIQKGQCFGFLGPNGAGKTTTMRMLYLASRPSGGDLVVFDHDVSQLKDDYMFKSRVGVVPQEDNLDQELTTREVLEVFCRFYGLYGQAARDRTDELLEYVGLTEKSDRTIEMLSGGMKRRLQIARGLIGKPELLILDEPTTGLDPQIRNLLWDNLKDLKQRQVTMVLTTHYMNEAEQLCDDLVIMDLGKIIARGHPRVLIRDHVPAQVIEVIYDDQTTEHSEWLLELQEKLDYTNKLNDRVLLYTSHTDELMQHIQQQSASVCAYLRHATLEDVFLKITGKRLDS